MINETKVINGNEMLTILMNVDKSKQVNLKYLVDQLMNKEKKNDGTKELNPYYNQVKKLVSGNFKLSNYQSRVVVNGTKEGIDMSEWESLKPSGKHYISYCVLEKDTDSNVKYLSFEPIENFSKPQIEYYFEGNTIEKHLFDSWITKKSESSRQPQEKEVMWRTIDLTNIKEFTLDSIRYIVEGN